MSQTFDINPLSEVHRPGGSGRDREQFDLFDSSGQTEFQVIGE
jgi:hypothetical protein